MFNSTYIGTILCGPGDEVAQYRHYHEGAWKVVHGCATVKNSVPVKVFPLVPVWSFEPAISSTVCDRLQPNYALLRYKLSVIIVIGCGIP